MEACSNFTSPPSNFIFSLRFLVAADNRAEVESTPYCLRVPVFDGALVTFFTLQTILLSFAVHVKRVGRGHVSIYLRKANNSQNNVRLCMKNSWAAEAEEEERSVFGLQKSRFPYLILANKAPLASTFCPQAYCPLDPFDLSGSQTKRCSFLKQTFNVLHAAVRAWLHPANNSQLWF